MTQDLHMPPGFDTRSPDWWQAREGRTVRVIVGTPDGPGCVAVNVLRVEPVSGWILGTHTHESYVWTPLLLAYFTIASDFSAPIAN